ncbi:threonine/serine dehydratase [Bordetella parapertussis]|uniref:Amino-acid dehydratase n=4 Tax=Bordetella TaxID=517 RepID=K0MLZ6_BORPB|nr:MULTISPECIES: threonine/serine dehydratase [Bordetella]AMG87753.1 serine/threonine dehydratase [Bordetella bronchiseptica]AOB38359.1 serine/threonine dehydratase [Bordetella parapertussis]AUL42338.1 serine/threonine dehydratase [Bordetella parapertussis]AWP62250.1 serine/threonine dehydratase [Bordetella parapertussis]AWP69750.1 serine/threonine dehydratase [Bordetella parapertussis]
MLDVTSDTSAVPDSSAIAYLHAQLQRWVRATPILEKTDFEPVAGIAVCFKFELLQASGTFKARGAFSHLLALDDAQRQAGATCVSAGNHAVAVAYAAMRLGLSAKVVMIKTASPARVALCRQYGAEVVLADDGPQAFETVRRIENEEGRYFVHPFNGYRTVLGTATLGHEWLQQAGELDAVIVPVGGGGLISGVATAIKLAAPQCQVIGVEPEGADAMHRSFAAGGPIRMGPMHSIADSLMAPHTEQYTYDLCRRHVDRLVKVDDHALRAAMRLLFDQLKLATEPACAAATAALAGPLRNDLAGRRVGVLLCGTNTDPATFARHLGAD